LSQKAATVTLTELPLDDPSRRVWTTSRGEPVEHARPVPSRKHTVASVAAFLEAVKLWGPGGVIWHSDAECILVCDDAERRDLVRLPLELHQQWETVVGLCNPFDQRGAVNLLRFTLRDCVPVSVMDAVRKVEAAWKGTASREIQQGREKGMGEFAAALANELPEVFPCRVPVYDVADFRPVHEVQLGLEVTLPPQPLTFRFALLPGEQEKAVSLAQEALHALLLENEHERPVLYGSPS
jgi:hypothetical protein